MPLRLGGRVTANFGGVDVVPLPLQGARGDGDDQLWGSAIAGCHCRVPEGRVETNFGGVDVVPLLGAIVMCYGWGGG